MQPRTARCLRASAAKPVCRPEDEAAKIGGTPRVASCNSGGRTLSAAGIGSGGTAALVVVASDSCNPDMAVRSDVNGNSFTSFVLCVTVRGRCLPTVFTCASSLTCPGGSAHISEHTAPKGTAASASQPGAFPRCSSCCSASLRTLLPLSEYLLLQILWKETRLCIKRSNDTTTPDC